MFSSHVAKPPMDLDALWQTIKTALDRLFDFPDEAFHVDAPNTLSSADYVLAYTTMHEIVRNRQTGRALLPRHRRHSGLEVYPMLEGYFTNLCTELCSRLLALDANSSEFVEAYVHCYNNYHRRLLVAQRVLVSFEKSVVPAAGQDGGGWIKCPLPEVHKPRERISIQNGIVCGAAQSSTPVELERLEWFEHLEEHEREALAANWELPDNAVKGDAEWNGAVMRVEAGHDPVETPHVGVKALALRRWRLHILEPLVERIMENVEVAHDGQFGASVATIMKDVGLQKDDDRRRRMRTILTRIG